MILFKIKMPPEKRAFNKKNLIYFLAGAAFAGAASALAAGAAAASPGTALASSCFN
jgi:hypothetical protein